MKTKDLAKNCPNYCKKSIFHFSKMLTDFCVPTYFLLGEIEKIAYQYVRLGQKKFNLASLVCLIRLLAKLLLNH